MDECWLNERLTAPSPALIADMAGIRGDILVLGAGGKMGPTLCLLAKEALAAAGNPARVIAVSRFSEPGMAEMLSRRGVEVLAADLLDSRGFEVLPLAENVVYMAGRKFGTHGSESLTWAMNAWLPSRVAERYRESNIVVFSSGNIYPQTPVSSGGADESTPPDPVGEYAMSCLARERMFEYAASRFGTPVAVYRLNYACDLRYGVLCDIARAVREGAPVPLSMGCFNCIWQGDANEAALRLLRHTSPEVFRLNVTGPETASVRGVAEAFGRYFGIQPHFTGEEGPTALLNNAAKMFSLFGYPSVSLGTMLGWQAEWLSSGGRLLNKPTHFEEKKGRY